MQCWKLRHEEERIPYPRPQMILLERLALSLKLKKGGKLSEKTPGM